MWEAVPSSSAGGDHPWSAGFRTLSDEFDYRVDEIDGRGPSALRGTLFRNGSGRRPRRPLVSALVRRRWHDFAPHGYPGERCDSLVFDASEGRTKIGGLDARDIAAAPLFVARLKHHVPFSLHGTFTSRLFQSVAFIPQPQVISPRGKDSLTAVNDSKS